jgi:hypothetical protein
MHFLLQYPKKEYFYIKYFYETVLRKIPTLPSLLCPLIGLKPWIGPPLPTSQALLSLLPRTGTDQHAEPVRLIHGPNNYKDTKFCMSSFLVFNGVYRLETQSVMLVFSTPLVN